MRLKTKILVVDDDEKMLIFVGEVLRKMGAETHLVQSSQQASELINKEKFDGVFLDWKMPEIDGLELTRRIRWSQSNSHCPIVMLTGVTDASALKECFQAGVNFFLQKPVTMQHLKSLLNASRGVMLQERRRYQRAPAQIPVLCQWKSLDTTIKTTGESVNLSSDGLLVSLEELPPLRASVNLKFSLPGDPEPLQLVGQVARYDVTQRVGISFTQLTKPVRQRLMDFTERILADTRTPVFEPTGPGLIAKEVGDKKKAQ